MSYATMAAFGLASTVPQTTLGTDGLYVFTPPTVDALWQRLNVSVVDLAMEDEFSETVWVRAPHASGETAGKESAIGWALRKLNEGRTLLMNDGTSAEGGYAEVLTSDAVILYAARPAKLLLPRDQPLLDAQLAKASPNQFFSYINTQKTPVFATPTSATVPSLPSKDTGAPKQQEAQTITTANFLRIGAAVVVIGVGFILVSGTLERAEERKRKRS